MHGSPRATQVTCGPLYRLRKQTVLLLPQRTEAKNEPMSHRSSSEGNHCCNSQRPAQFGRFVITSLPKGREGYVSQDPSPRSSPVGLSGSPVSAVTFTQRSLNELHGSGITSRLQPAKEKPLLLMNLIQLRCCGTPTPMPSQRGNKAERH